MNVNIIKQTGKVYTPPLLSKFIAKQLVNKLPKSFIKKSLKVLDPAVGSGNLLIALDNLLPNNQFYGIDINQEAINNTKHNFKSNHIKHYSLKVTDYLSPQNKVNSMDIIIANPPYVRVQNMDTKLTKEVNKYSIEGKEDLYQAFIIKMTRQLKANGYICFITSNKYLYNKSGASTRKFLRDNYEIKKLIDLGDTKVFNASVLPAIFIGKKKPNVKNQRVPFQSIYTTKSTHNAKCYPNIFEALDRPITNNRQLIDINNQKYQLTSGLTNIKNTNAPISLTSTSNLKWANQLATNNQTFGDIFNIHVGIKTTADYAFIKNNWNNVNDKPERSLLHDLISAKKLTKWNDALSNNYNIILYPYTLVNGKRQVINLNKYPKAAKYLNSYKKRLSSRKYVIKAGRKWYEIWVPQDMAKLLKPKLIVPDISTHAKFSLDLSSKFVDGNCYWLEPKAKFTNKLKYLYLGLIVANSDIIQRFHSIKFQNRLYSGKRRFMSQYISKYPFPNIQNHESQKLIKYSKNIVDNSHPEKYYQKYKKQINNLVFKSLTNKATQVKQTSLF